jgi:hypothetical protein
VLQNDHRVIISIETVTKREVELIQRQRRLRGHPQPIEMRRKAEKGGKRNMRTAT